MLRGDRVLRRAVLMTSMAVAASFVAAPAVAADDGESVLGQDGGALVLVLDGSGSMKESAGGGRTRMEAAKDGLDEVIEQLPSDSQVGLRVYGSTISDGPGSCEDSELLAPVETVDKAALKRAVGKLKPLGNTPIAYSLEQAYEDLPAEGPRSIVLVSDGEENCQGDPCAVARDLRKKGAEFYVDVVGLQVDGKSRNQLTCVASAGGGTYYDVKDIDQLESALTRTSVRAARGYEPAGLPVEGGESAQQAVEIDDGQWLDTVGDSGEEFYTLPDPGEGTIHASVAQPRTGTFFESETLQLTVASAGGQACGSPVRAQSGGNDEGLAPVTAAIAVTAEDRESCGDGPYVLGVQSDEVRGVASLEVAVRTEPAVEDVDSLPAGGGDADVEGDAPSEDAVSVVGGPNFSAAPPTTPGTYEDTLLVGETLYYRVPDVQWGQQVVCDLEVQPTDEAADILGFGGATTPVSTAVYGPMKAQTRIGGGDNVARYGGKEVATAHASSPPVTYRNREQAGDYLPAASLDGDYYCQVSSLEPRDTTAAKIGEMPIRLTVSVVGEVAGEPTYASEPKPTANDAESDESSDGGLAWGWIALGVVVLLALLAGLLAALRRGRKADDEADTTPPVQG